MELSTIIGVVAGFISIFVGMVLKGAPLTALNNPAAFLIIIGGTFSCLFIGFPMSELKKLPKDKFDVDLEVRLSTRSAQYCKIYNWKHSDGPSPFGKPKKSVNWDHEEFCVMHYRAVRFGLKTGKTETIVTSLPREKFPPSKIKKLYNMRWRGSRLHSVN